MLTETCYFRYHHFNFQQLDLQLNFQLCSWRTLRSRTTSGSITGSWGRGSSGSWRSWRRPLTTPRVMVDLPPISCQGEQPQIKITWQWKSLSWFFCRVGPEYRGYTYSLIQGELSLDLMQRLSAADLEDMLKVANSSTVENFLNIQSFQRKNIFLKYTPLDLIYFICVL